MSTSHTINGNRLLLRLEEFARIGATAKGGVNRQALTELDRRARRLLTELARARGFSVFQDPAANLFVRREGRDADLPPLLIGSHLDSQPTGGRFDGALGTLAAYEVLESLEDKGIETECPVEVVAWMNEEGCRFAPGCMGSSAFAAGAIPQSWATIISTDGSSLKEELAATLEALPEAAMRPLGFPVAAYLEVHIEQGPSLEKEGIPIGIVTGIQGTRWLEVKVTGQAAHAGTTGLEYRRDPMRALSEALAELFGTVMPQDERARFTVGQMTLSPGAVNAIPEIACCTVDARHVETGLLDSLVKRIGEVLKRHAETNGCTVELRETFNMAPATFPSGMLDVLSSAAETAGLQSKKILSGAFHDALFVNRVAPSAMIFVPCRDGLSHNEAEFVEPDWSIAGGSMLFSAVMELLARRGSAGSGALEGETPK
ncbi:Zn-dependent hydrolase [Roseibium marinum]|uniref:N-carbamoyl-L-amino-acid hydrolase n=1 Tax=Roseibium marinum TaxID=281252 RepID=A0A2S3UKP9_9HYPH|nr:Zn-dependent hydrolase [Roseibium marinum]POF28261.1 N-carbamoyl-L-amino-acid hydrolase [Roseibium marinum]